MPLNNTFKKFVIRQSSLLTEATMKFEQIIVPTFFIQKPRAIFSR